MLVSIIALNLVVITRDLNIQNYIFAITIKDSFVKKNIMWKCIYFNVRGNNPKYLYSYLQIIWSFIFVTFILFFKFELNEWNINIWHSFICLHVEFKRFKKDFFWICQVLWSHDIYWWLITIEKYLNICLLNN